MPNYLETIYFKNESDAGAYPQKLCGHLVKTYLAKGGSVDGATILDIGSGKGNHLLGFSRFGLKPSGLDKRPECLEAVCDFDIRACDLEGEPFPFDNNSFDFVYSKSVLEHVTNTDNLVGESLRVLKPGGMALMLTPDWRSQRASFWDDYTHVKPFTRKGLQNAMRINGFENVECSYFRQLPIEWAHPWMGILVALTKLLPDKLIWRDKAESDFREWIRFSKEEMLLATGFKPNEA